MNNKDKFPWCIDPFISFSHTADGFYRPCCIGTVDRHAGLNIKNVTPLEYFTGDEMNSLRSELLKGEPTSEHNKFLCRQCIKNDQDGVKSRRITQNETFLPRDYIQDLLEQYNDPSYIATPEDIKYVNFKILGNLCNLKCLMCGPSASSKIAAEWKKHNIFKHGNMKSAEKNPYDENSKDTYMADLDKIISNVDKFNLVGGEAFINPNFDEIWKILSKNENSKNINLLIITNGTKIPQHVLDDANKFKNLRLLFSIDGVYNRGSYVRSGLDWELFDKNVKRALASNANCSFTVATSMLNIGYLDDIYHYLKSLDVPDKDISWDGIVTEPSHLRAINIPSSIKKMYLEKLEKTKIFKSDSKRHTSALDILNSDSNNHNEFLLGLQFLKKTDEIRNTQLLDHFPEFKEWYNSIVDLKTI